MNAKELVAQFIEDYLGGDISRLATFPLGNLRNDKVYGCPGRNFDSDDTELMRAIYCLVFGEVWEGLSMDNLGDGKLRGDTLNTYNTLFSQPWNEKFAAIWNPDDELKAKMKEFQTTCYTIGNMASFLIGALENGALTSIEAAIMSGTIMKIASWRHCIWC